MNSLLENLKQDTNYSYTENGGRTHTSTLNKVYDMFAFGGSYRSRTDEDCILLFKQALEEDEFLAMKCLFYLRDVRGGQGERRFFRVCFRWLANEYPYIVDRNLVNVSAFGRWDDLIYSCIGTKAETGALLLIKEQLALDVKCETPSLLAKWLPSENASSDTTKAMANVIRSYLGLTHKQYRKLLSGLRTKINVLEKLMSSNQWDKIVFDKIPSKAGMIYRNAFARRDIIAKQYEAFIKDENTKVNADTLYPYEIVRKARVGQLSDLEVETLEKYWDNQKDYLNGKPCKMLCVCDTSGSMAMTWHSGGNVLPIDIAISLSMYCAERVGEPFKNHYISFSSRPQLIHIDGVNFVDKVKRIYKTNLCENTNIEATFDLLKDVSLKAKPEDRLDTVIIISDMEIDCMTTAYYSEDELATDMELIRKEWKAAGLECPKLVYWNVNARNNNILDLGPNVSFVSGASPVLFESVLTGKTGIDLMLDKLLGSERYRDVK